MVAGRFRTGPGLGATRRLSTMQLLTAGRIRRQGELNDKRQNSAAHRARGSQLRMGACMTVQELIDEMQRIPDKSLEVHIEFGDVTSCLGIDRCEAVGVEVTDCDLWLLEPRKLARPICVLR